MALFDLDGTLVDSGPTIIASVRMALDQLDYPVPDANAIRAFVGPPLLTGITEVLGVPKNRAVEFRNTYRAIYAKHMLAAMPYPGILAALTQLTADGWTLGVATSKREDLAEAIVTGKGLLQHFRVVAGSDIAELHAGKALVITRALELLHRQGIDGSAAVMIGDRHHDIIGAAEHNLRSVFVTWGYGTESEARGADAVIADPAQLAQALLSLPPASSPSHPGCWPTGCTRK